ncbi:hypothetical protein [Prevotella sp. 10(H)]|uniref:hypothetical protein n=1 Tax=Prevotella sp. 10(H) TaxID=1158294 RepID=UPI0004A70F11|nr:hypothetical protein [Prevotella sp. 10(H)]
MQNETKNQGCNPRRPTNGLPAERNTRAPARFLSMPLSPGVSPAAGQRPQSQCDDKNYEIGSS